MRFCEWKYSGRRFDIRLVVLVALNLGATVCCSQSTAQLQQVMEHLLVREKLCGAVWSIVYDNGAISTGAAGYKNSSTKTLLQATDKVQVGSIAKTV